MGILKAVTDSVSGTLADQWKDIYTARPFNEHDAIVPGTLKNTNRGRGANLYGSDGVITNGSRIFIPENTAAYVFSQAGIETIVTESGNYVYESGEESVFHDGIGSIVLLMAASLLLRSESLLSTYARSDISLLGLVDLRSITTCTISAIWRSIRTDSSRSRSRIPLFFFAISFLQMCSIIRSIIPLLANRSLQSSSSRSSLHSIRSQTPIESRNCLHKRAK